MDSKLVTERIVGAPRGAVSPEGLLRTSLIIYRSYSRADIDFVN